jgi:ABC-2 type transport system ATP-binding protein
MRQRLGIAAALLRKPRLLLLDEPTTGLDPVGMRDMRTLIRRLAGEGITVMLSSHQLTEVEEVCNRVAIIRSGGVVFEGGLDELRRTAATSYRLRTTDSERAASICAEQPGLRDLKAAVDGHDITFMADEKAVAELSVALVEGGIAITALIPQRPSLEDLFFHFIEGDGAGPAARVMDVA